MWRRASMLMAFSCSTTARRLRGDSTARCIGPLLGSNAALCFFQKSCSPEKWVNRRALSSPGSEARGRAFFFCLAARHSAHPHATRSHTRSRRRARSRVSRDPRPTPALYPSVAPSFLSASQSYLPEPENPRPHPQRFVIVWLPSTLSYAGFPSPPASLEGSGLEEGVPVVLSELPDSAASFAPSCCTATEARAALRNFSVRVLS